MRRFNKTLLLLFLSVPLYAHAADQPPAPSGPDTRYPVQLTPEEALRQKAEMRNNLVALRTTLTALADKDFATVETSVRKLVHEGPVGMRPGVSTSVFRKLETDFEASIDRTVQAARSQNVDVVLRALGDTMAYCQSCHMAFRQSLEPKAAPAPPQ